MPFSSTDVDPEDDDPNAAIMESWHASIRRQAQLLMALAVSRKRNELLQRRKDGSVVQQVMAHEFAQLERASALQSSQHAHALDGLRRGSRALEARLGVTVETLSETVAQLEETHRLVEHTLTEALRDRSRELQKEQALSNRLDEQAKTLVALLSTQEATSQQLEVRATAAEARVASLDSELEAKEEGVKEMGQRMADVVATQQAEHALQVDEMRREVAEAQAQAKAEAEAAAAAAERAMEEAVLTATRTVRQEAELYARTARQAKAEAEAAAAAAERASTVRQQAESAADALHERVARAEACVAHTAFVRNVAVRVLCRLLDKLGVPPLDPSGAHLPGTAPPIGASPGHSPLGQPGALGALGSLVAASSSPTLRCAFSPSVEPDSHPTTRTSRSALAPSLEVGSLAREAGHEGHDSPSSPPSPPPLPPSVIEAKVAGAEAAEATEAAEAAEAAEAGAEAAGAEADGGGSPGSGGLVCREVARAAARSRSNQPTTDPTRSPHESHRVPPTVPRGLLQLGAAPDATPWEMDLLG